MEAYDHITAVHGRGSLIPTAETVAAGSAVGIRDPRPGHKALRSRQLEQWLNEREFNCAVMRLAQIGARLQKIGAGVHDLIKVIQRKIGAKETEVDVQVCSGGLWADFGGIVSQRTEHKRPDPKRCQTTTSHEPRHANQKKLCPVPCVVLGMSCVHSFF